MTNTENIKTGKRFTFTRRDATHGYLTFHVEVLGVHGGLVSYAQTAIKYPHGTEPASLRGSTRVADFAAIYTEEAA